MSFEELKEYLDALQDDNSVPDAELDVSATAPVRETLAALISKIKELVDYLDAQKSIPVPELDETGQGGEGKATSATTGGGLEISNLPGGLSISSLPDVGSILGDAGETVIFVAKVQSNATDLDAISVKILDSAGDETGDAFNVSGKYLESSYTIPAIDPDPGAPAIRGTLEHNLPQTGDILIIIRLLDSDEGVVTFGPVLAVSPFLDTNIKPSGASMVSGAHVDQFVNITAGTGSGQRRKVLSNSNAVLTISTGDTDWDVTPAADSEFDVRSVNEWYALPPWIQVAEIANVEDNPATDLDTVSVKAVNAADVVVGEPFNAVANYLPKAGDGTGKHIFPERYDRLFAIRSANGEWVLIPPWVEYGDGIEVDSQKPRVDLDIGTGHDQVTDSGLERGVAGIRLSRPAPADINMDYLEDIATGGPGLGCVSITQRNLQVEWTDNRDGRAQQVDDTAVQTFLLVATASSESPDDPHTHAITFTVTTV